MENIISYRDKTDFVDSLRRMRMAGGLKQQASKTVENILGRAHLGMSREELGRLNRNGESRIKDCYKYTLPGGCRLVTAQPSSNIIFLFVGDHEEADHWIKQNQGMEYKINPQKKTITPVKFNKEKIIPFHIPPNLEENKNSLLDKLAFPEFEDLVPKKKIREILFELNQDSSEEDILDSLDLLDFDKEVNDLFFDLIISLRNGDLLQAEARLEVFRGQSQSIENEDLLRECLDSGVNSERVVDFGKMTPDEISRLLDPQKFEDWMLFLHPEQKKIVEASYSRPVILKGVSGSGKTVVLIHRARELARRYPGENIGIITLNRDLAKLIENLIEKLCLDGESDRIFVQAYYDYFTEVVNHFGCDDYLGQLSRNVSESNYEWLNILQETINTGRLKIREKCPTSEEDLNDTWDEFWHSEIPKTYHLKRTKDILLRDFNNKFDVESYIRDEFDLIRSAFSLDKRVHDSDEDYYSYSRVGRSVRFSLGIREHILELLFRYEEYMLWGGLMDAVGLGQVISPIYKKLRNLPDKLTRRCLLIDEFQDFSTMELRYLKAISPAKKDGFFLAGDFVQKVLVKDFNLEEAYLGRSDVEKVEIKKNYRNSRQILLAANELAQKFGGKASKNDSAIEIINPEYAVRQTAKPIAVSSENVVSEAWDEALKWVSSGNYEPSSVCLVSANAKRLSIEEIRNGCPPGNKANIIDGDYMKRKEMFNVGTLSGVKGFEFSLIIVVGMSSDIIPDPSYPEEEHWRDALRLYVAMTRGREQVVLVYNGERSIFLEEMKDFITWTS